jgi:hypothetical protein
MTEQEVRAIALLARLEVRSIHKLANGYSPNRTDPWWLVNFDIIGLVEIGWRKRVISIDWSATDVRGEVTRFDVTKSETNAHAYSMGDAVNYLEELKRLAVSKRWADANPEEATEQAKRKAAYAASDADRQQNQETT